MPCLCFFSTSLLLFVSVTPQREPYECLINLIVAVLNRHRCAIVEVLETRPTKRVFSFERKKNYKRTPRSEAGSFSTGCQVTRAVCNSFGGVMNIIVGEMKSVHINELT